MFLLKSFWSILESLVSRVHGLTETSKANPILGLSDTETVKLDFDDVSFKTVRYWASRTRRWFKLQGFIVLRPSKNRYQVVFDRVVSWAENMRVVAWVALLSHNKGLAKWLLMQCIKGCSTLRVSSKRGKPSPRIVYRQGKQDDSIKSFLKTRKIIKKISQKTHNNAWLSSFYRLFWW